MNYQEKLRSAGVIVPELIIPNRRTDNTKYACVACDQYTSQPEYWDEVKEYVGKEVSTLYFTMPEVWLDKKTGEPLTQEYQDHRDLIPANMKFFLVNGSLDELDPGMIYVKRTLSEGEIRHGLMLAVDLECYDSRSDSKALIKATEKTVAERVPIRQKVRSKAPLEVSHIMLLYADKEDKLNHLLEEKCTENKIYDFDLMKASGHLTGYFVDKEDQLDQIADILIQYKDAAKDGIAFGVGDGNHSLAAAKAHWDHFKKFIPEAQRTDHPARFALVELVNLYDEAMHFEPIHRILYNVDPKAVQEELGFDAANPPDLQDLQPKLDEYLAKHKEASIDYIHGLETAKELEAKDPEHSLAICWDSYDKDSLFDNVNKYGSLVRKSFSLGHAQDKRFYYEARRITKINKEHIVPNASWNL